MKYTSQTFDVPVLLIIFNRPKTTARVFDAIRQIKPRTLLVTADGPRSAAEATLCDETRAIVEKVDWECEVLTNFSDVNLGSPYACSRSISWAFEHVDRAIILEDDCLPNRSFFEFCALMLDRYADSDQVMHICGSNFIPYRDGNSNSYHFSKYISSWGWATWRRAWDKFDLTLSKWPASERAGLLKSKFPTRFEQKYWKYFFDRVYNKKSVHWDYAWQFACLAEDGCTIVPNANLVSNIGFDKDATHTKNPENYLANRPVESLDPKDIRHPSTVSVDDEADRLTFLFRHKNDKRTALQKIRATALKRFRRVAGRLIVVLPQRNRVAVTGAVRKVLRAGLLAAARITRIFVIPPLPQNPDGKNLVHLGCGNINHPGFIKVDLLPLTHIHYIRPVDKLGMFADCTIDLVYASHCLQRFPHSRLQDVIGEWHRVLKPGGLLRLSVPDFDLLLKIYEDSGQDVDSILKMLMGSQDQPSKFHYSIFNRAALTSALKSAGFRTVRTWVPGSSMLCSLPDGSGRSVIVNGKSYLVSLNFEAVK